MQQLLQSLFDSAINDGVVDKMAKNSNLDANSTRTALSKLAPALLGKAQENFKGPQDSSPFLDLIRQFDLDSVAKHPEELEDTNRGNALLGQLTGSKDGSRALASQISNESGIDVSSIKKLLPMVAPLIAGLLNQQAQAANTQDNNSLTSMLSQLLDGGNGGSIAQNLMNLASKFFR